MASDGPPLARGAVSALTPTELRSVQHAVQNLILSDSMPTHLLNHAVRALPCGRRIRRALFALRLAHS